MLKISEKLLEFRTNLRFNQTQIAEKVGVSQRTWSNYEMGVRNPPMKVLIELEKLGFQYREPAEEPVQAVQSIVRNRPREIEGELIKYGTESGAPSDGFIIPLVDQSLSAGFGSFLPEDDTPVAYIAVPRQLRRFGQRLVALYVDGDSMEPTFTCGDMIVCDSLGWDGEGIYAIQIDGSGFVKRLSRKPGQLVVISDNPRYEPYEVPLESDDIRIIGKVRGVLHLV